MRTWRREGGDSDGDGATLSDPRVREALSGQGVYARAHGSAAPARRRVAWRMAPGGDRAPMCGPWRGWWRPTGGTPRQNYFRIKNTPE
jgi:hypothetical protein